jgi:hypothetical protein
MRILSGWKQIANYMQQGVRTVQRWELTFGLPVHRPKAGARGAVMAFAEELDGWGKTTPVRISIIPELRAKVASLEAEVLFLKDELRAAHAATFPALSKRIRLGLVPRRNHINTQQSGL